jgi:hypothetical protein
MLSDKEKNYIIEVLIREVSPVERPRETLTAPFYGTTFPRDLTQGNPGQLVMDAVRLCLVDAWNNDPPWLVMLLRIFPLETIDAKIAEIVERIGHKPPPAPDPLDSSILNNGTPFVNRALLRLHLRRLATQAATVQPIFIVNGTAKSGKSYSANYIEQFSYTTTSVIPYRLEFDSELGLETGPVQVARDLVSMMGRPLDSIPRPDTNQKLYTRQLALWVLNEAAQTNSQHWFILDNFRGDTLRPDTRDLLIVLSDRITTGVFPQRCRLILIGFDRALLTVDPGKIEEEMIAPLPPAEVNASLREILSRAPVPVNFNRISTLILSGLPAGEKRMPELNTRLRALLQAISEVQQILAVIPGTDYEEVLVKMLENLPGGQESLQELRKRLEDLRESAAEL